MLKLEVGQKVWLKPYKKQFDPKEVTVSKIGRKYFHIKERPNTRFYLYKGWEYSEIDYRDRIYLTLQEIKEEDEYNSLVKFCREKFSHGFSYTLETYRKIKNVLDNADKKSDDPKDGYNLFVSLSEEEVIKCLNFIEKEREGKTNE